jgi:predicted lipoprotein with Yx(FWY)xxD motif
MTRESSVKNNRRRPDSSFRLRPARVFGRAIRPGLAAAAIASLAAACGSSGASAGASGTAAPGDQPVTSHGSVISTASLPGIGTVLVTPSGKTVYSPQQEARGKILCVGGCLSFWFPVSVARGAALHAASGLDGVLGTVHRPGGGTQLTYNGKPLYTFRLDGSPGQANGNNFTDHFGSLSFTWHALTTAGTPAKAGSPSSSYAGGSSGY